MIEFEVTLTKSAYGGYNISDREKLKHTNAYSENLNDVKYICLTYSSKKLGVQFSIASPYEHLFELYTRIAENTCLPNNKIGETLQLQELVNAMANKILVSEWDVLDAAKDKKCRRILYDERCLAQKIIGDTE